MFGIGTSCLCRENQGEEKKPRFFLSFLDKTLVVFLALREPLDFHTKPLTFFIIFLVIKMKRKNLASIREFKKKFNLLSSSDSDSSKNVQATTSKSSSSTHTSHSSESLDDFYQELSNDHDFFIHPQESVQASQRLFRVMSTSPTELKKKQKKQYTLSVEQKNLLHCCNSGCIKNVPYEKVKKVRDMMQEMTENQRTDKVRSHMETSYDETSQSLVFFFGSVMVCRTAFQKIYKISNNKYNSVRNHMLQEKNVVHGNSNIEKSTIKKITFDNWIQLMKENYCDVSPSGVAQFYFPISMLKKDFYNFYLEDINDQDKCYGIRQFMTCIKKSKVKFTKTSALGKCSTCIEIQTQLKKKNLRTADRDKIITQKDEHLNEISEKKALYYSHIRKSKSNNHTRKSEIEPDDCKF